LKLLLIVGKMTAATRKKATASAIFIMVVLIMAFMLWNSGSPAAKHPTTAYAPRSGIMRVVAAENFWGSLAAQLCGIHCNVTSIIVDPNADPHEYQSNAAVAKLISNATLVIVNGVGYDSWALKLINASYNQNRTVINAGKLLGLPSGSNPHIWYDPAYVNATVREIYLDLANADPSNSGYYRQQYLNLTASLAKVDGMITEIRDNFSGTRVASTESVFVYLANATGLNLVSPPDFMDAVSEGTTPSTQSVITFENQLETGNVSLMVYNEQTITPLTQQMKQIAMQHNVTVVGVTEIIEPPNASYQTWMTSELSSLRDALNASSTPK
jgi:zinc/manganese transport system substrate-binding protein